jgi:hypothetical protein
VYQSDSVDYTYYQIEVEDDYGTLYKIFSKRDVFECETLTYLWLCEGGVEYDTNIDEEQIKFLQSVFGNATKI